MSRPCDARVEVIPRIADIAPAAWDACANPAAADLPHNPFIAYDFLRSLEDSGSAVARAGWQPQHLVAESAGGDVLGAVP
ncbi:MAG TPA: peptidogalycan biosysnthesis protein, partial [Hyphomicrobiaceae bacterium]|nr:peptidogalycan biosysnthesis protein [Hyphomicrobiaceae bacterium]